jgi:hypothetical protein
MWFYVRRLLQWDFSQNVHFFMLIRLGGTRELCHCATATSRAPQSINFFPHFIAIDRGWVWHSHEKWAKSNEWKKSVAIMMMKMINYCSSNEMWILTSLHRDYLFRKFTFFYISIFLRFALWWNQSMSSAIAVCIYYFYYYYKLDGNFSFSFLSLYVSPLNWF